METDELIRRLADDVRPVRPLRAPWLRALVWLAISVPPLAAVIWWHGLGTKAGMATADLRMVIEELAVLATAYTAAAAAFASAIPGVSRRWLWVPLLPLSVWLLTIGQGCIADYSRLGLAAFSLRSDSDCFTPMVLIAIVPTLAIGAMIRRAAPVMPRLTLALAGLAVAGIVNLGLLLFHVGDISFMVLVWHLGGVLTVVGITGLLGRFAVVWRLPFAK